MPKPQMYRLTKFKKTLEAVSRVLEHGENKYKDDLNFLSYPFDKDLDAALRHVFEAENKDEETGEYHTIHAICRLMFASEKMING